MLGLEKVRFGVKVFFHLLQIAIVLSGSFTFLVVYLLFTRANSLIPISLGLLAPISAISVLSITSGFLGLNSLNSERKTKVFLFILTLAALMNMQIILVLKSDRLMDKRVEWMNARWNGMSDSQRNFVQRMFKCCGLETTGDRAGQSCRHDRPCGTILKAMLKTIRNISQGVLIYMFFIESLSLCALSFLKFIK